MDMTPLVTVCVTTYNRRNLVPSTIKSILQQTYRNFEIIIVDDCSTDGTQSLIEKKILNIDGRIKYIRHKTNKGLSSARNTAINNANGKYFTFIDDDDIWDKDFINSFINLSKDYDGNCSFCASNISNNTSIKALSGYMKDFLMLGYTPPVGSQFYKTDILKEIGGYNVDIKSGVDHDLWISLGQKKHRLIWLNKKMIHVNNIPSSNRMTYNLKKRIEGINNSLQIWSYRSSKYYGKKFFSCLGKNYIYNTYKKFILLSISEKEFGVTVMYFKKLPKDLFILDLKRYLSRRMGNHSILKYPTFLPCNTKWDTLHKNIKIIYNYEA
jgi:glycosyltransferase involved in cell wall biosynthesis